MPINSSATTRLPSTRSHFSVGRKALVHLPRRAVSLHLLEYPASKTLGEACIPEQNSMIFEWRTALRPC